MVTGLSAQTGHPIIDTIVIFVILLLLLLRMILIARFTPFMKMHLNTTCRYELLQNLNVAEQFSSLCFALTTELFIIHPLAFGYWSGRNYHQFCNKHIVQHIDINMCAVFDKYKPVWQNQMQAHILLSYLFPQCSNKKVNHSMPNVIFQCHINHTTKCGSLAQKNKIVPNEFIN